MKYQQWSIPDLPAQAVGIGGCESPGASQLLQVLAQNLMRIRRAQSLLIGRVDELACSNISYHSTLCPSYFYQFTTFLP